MADTEPTQQNPVTPDGRSPAAFEIGQFRAQFQKLPLVTTRKATGVDQVEAGDLFTAMGQAIDEWARRAKAEADGKARLLTQVNTYKEQLTGKRTEAPPAVAVAAMSRGQLGSEAIIDQAKAEADRILDDARLQAAAMVSEEQPRPTGHRPTDFANMVAYVTSQKPVLRKKLDGLDRLEADLHAEATSREAEREAWGRVLPLARQQLAAGVIDVRESEVAS